MRSRLALYLTHNFASSFFPLFFTLFTISSIIAIIKLADITAIIRLSSGDFFKLFLFGVPQLFFYSVPISFFIAASLSLSKLSFDSEITAMMALGATKKDVVKPLTYMAIVFSSFLLFLGIVLIPMANSTAKAFIDAKKATSRLNLEPNSVGQKFGSWYVFALGEDKKLGFTDVVLYSREFKSMLGDSDLDVQKSQNSNDKIIYSKSAQVRIDNFNPVLTLKNGSALIYDENLSSVKVKKLKFESLDIREDAKDVQGENAYFVDYWLAGAVDKKRAKDFADTVLTALSPVATIVLAYVFGIGISRRDKNRAIIFSVAAISMYYLLILVISPKITFYAIPLILSIWFAFVTVVYKRSVFAKY